MNHLGDNICLKLSIPFCCPLFCCNSTRNASWVQGIDLPVLSMVHSPAVEQLYDYPVAMKVRTRDMGNIWWYLTIRIKTKRELSAQLLGVLYELPVCWNIFTDTWLGCVSQPHPFGCYRLINLSLNDFQLRICTLLGAQALTDIHGMIIMYCVGYSTSSTVLENTEINLK